jgi:hypothetical protein
MEDSKGLINSRSELHGACRHIPWFHRLSLKAPPSADERRKREQVDLASPPRLTRRRLDPAAQLLDLDGNEFESFHSQAEMDSSEFIFISVKLSYLVLERLVRLKPFEKRGKGRRILGIDCNGISFQPIILRYLTFRCLFLLLR